MRRWSWGILGMLVASEALAQPSPFSVGAGAFQGSFLAILTPIAVITVMALGVVEQDGRPRSELLKFLGLLVNGERQSWPLPSSPLAEVLPTSRLLFGAEAMEYRTPTETRLGAFLGIKEYPPPTSPGMLNRLLTAPFPLVLA